MVTHSFWWDIASPFLIAVAWPGGALRAAVRYGVSTPRERGYCWLWLVMAPVQAFVQCAMLVQHGAVAAASAGGLIAAVILAVAIAAVLRARRGDDVALAAP